MDNELKNNLIDNSKSTQDVNMFNFKWIDRLGEYIVNEATFYFDDSKIDKLYGEWMHIWSELNMPQEKKTQYIKQIDDLNVVSYKSNFFSNDFDQPSDFFVVPSFPKTDVLIHLPFWFSYNTNLSLPLISLQYQVCRVELNLKPLNKLFTLLIKNNIDDEPIRTVINSSQQSQHPSKFLKTFIIKKQNGGNHFDISYNDQIINEIDIKPMLKINYIYVDKEERNKFAKLEQNYLNLTIQKYNTILNSNVRVHKIDLSCFNGRCSKLCWILRRTDLLNLNQWSNFVNWPHKNKDPLFNLDDYSDFEINESVNTTNLASLKSKNICLSAKLILDGVDRFELKDANFFNLINNYSHSKNIPEDGIYVLSFELFTDTYNLQPNGFCNFSKFKSKYLELHLVEKEQNKNYNYELTVFSHKYNKLIFTSGMSNYEYAN